MVQISKETRRVYFIDELRGSLIFFIVLYHLLYDLTAIFGVNIEWVYSSFIEDLRTAAVGVFIIISGISCNYSKSNIKRGIKVFLWGVVITFVTLFALPDQIIIFGILHFLGCAMMICGLLCDILKKIPVKTGIIICLLLFIITYNFYYGRIGIGDISVKLPEIFMDKSYFFILGLKCEKMFSADYYPILPWIFIFLTGVFAGRIIKNNKAPRFFYKMHFRPVATAGRHTLMIYIIHQPVLIALLFLFFSLK